MLVAAGTKVDDLDAAPAWLFQQDVFWLEVAVDDPVSIQHIQTQQDGVGKLSNQCQAKPLELVLLDQLIQIHAEKLKRNTDVVPEQKMLREMNDVTIVVLILLFEMLQDTYLLHCLFVEAFLVAHHLQGHMLLGFVVVSLQDLTKTPFAENFEYLVPVCHVVVRHHLIRSRIVIVSRVIRPARHPLPLLCILSDKIHVLKS